MVSVFVLVIHYFAFSEIGVSNSYGKSYGITGVEKLSESLRRPIIHLSKSG